MNPTEQHRPHEIISDLHRVARMSWDIAVIGGGPAGSVAAALLAANGKKVLLIEKSAWPREKVCGGCLNASAVQALSGAGLISSFRPAQPINCVVWHVGEKTMEMAAPGGRAILRSDLDAALVSAAIQRGCTFLSSTAAKLLPTEPNADYRILQLTTAGVAETMCAKIILAADGIAGTSLDGETWANWSMQPRGWIGVSTLCFDSVLECPAGAIHMHIGRGGYVGAVRLPGDSVHIAAALDPGLCRHAGGPPCLIQKILYSAGQSISPEFQNQHLRGTPIMTRHRAHLGGHRVLVVGDACGYVEPFTGEGIAWAVQSAILAVHFLSVTEEWSMDSAALWTDLHGKVIAPKQRWCRALRPVLHHPTLATLAITSARIFPSMAHFISRQICESTDPVRAHFHGAIG